MFRRDLPLLRGLVDLAHVLLKIPPQASFQTPEAGLIFFVVI